LTTADVTLAAMKRRLLFIILLMIVLALLIKYGANAAARASEPAPPSAHPSLTIGAHESRSDSLEVF
jgi:hypothetical protein